VDVGSLLNFHDDSSVNIVLSIIIIIVVVCHGVVSARS